MSRYGEYYNPDNRSFAPREPRASENFQLPNQETDSSNNWFSFILVRILIPLVLFIIALVLAAKVSLLAGIIMGFVVVAYWVFLYNLNSFDAYMCGRCVEGSVRCAADNCS